MGPYYEHASLQPRAFARAGRQGRNGSLTLRSKGGASAVPDHDTQASTGLAAGPPTVPGVPLALGGVAGLLSTLITGDVWTMFCWRGLFSASIVVLAAVVSSLRLFAG